MAKKNQTVKPTKKVATSKPAQKATKKPQTVKKTEKVVKPVKVTLSEITVAEEKTYTAKEIILGGLIAVAIILALAVLF